MWNLTAEERVWRGRARRQNLGEQTMIWRLRSSTRSWCSLIKSTGTVKLNTSSAFLGQTEWLRSAFCKKSKANHKCFILVWHQMQQFKICLYSQVRLWDSFAHHERTTASSAVLYYLIWFGNYMAIQALRVQTKVDIKYPYLNTDAIGLCRRQNTVSGRRHRRLMCFHFLFILKRWRVLIWA